MSTLDDLKKTFFEECAEGLDSVERGLGEFEPDSAAGETVNAVFRAVHSIKGGAGVFGFEELVSFAHKFESVLDAIRHEKIGISEQTLELLLRANDTLADFVRLAQNAQPPQSGFGGDVAAQLDELIPGEDAAAEEDGNFADFAFTPVTASNIDEEEPSAARTVYEVTFRPSSARYDEDFLVLIRALRVFGAVQMVPDLSAIPLLAHFDPQAAYLSWRGTLESDVPFDLINDRVIALDLAGDWLVKRPGDGIEAVEPTFEAAAKVQEGPAVSEAVPEDRSEVTAKAGSANTTIRVDLDKIDRLVNIVGELVISQTMLHQLFQTSSVGSDIRMVRVMEDVFLHARELKDSVMSMRAQPVRSVFQRMSRVVREVAGKNGKKIILETVGENTEVDKAVIERLSDPLTHIIRNSIDHGIESPERRREIGKPEEGRIRLLADQRSSRIVIEISDDGAGLNPERILKKARDKGLVPEDAKLSDDEIYNLIFLPGFSTAETISDISGRGVGMDVVRRNIQELGGRVSLKSQLGKGMTIQLTLPLTLAVTDGMIVKVGFETYVIPISCIVECIRPSRSDVKALLGTRGTLQLRGAVIPIVHLMDLFAIERDPKQGDEVTIVIIETSEGERAGLVVDELCGHQQVVIKSIEDNYDAVPGIAGATILGDGQVAFILDAERLGGLSLEFPAVDRPCADAVTCNL